MQLRHLREVLAHQRILPLVVHLEEGGAKKPPPALLTSMSSAPNAAPTSADEAAAPARRRARRAQRRPPARRSPRTRATVAASRSASRSHTATCAPKRASASAIARPMPTAAPVTIATRSVSRMLPGSSAIAARRYQSIRRRVTAEGARSLSLPLPTGEHRQRAILHHRGAPRTRSGSDHVGSRITALLHHLVVLRHGLHGQCGLVCATVHVLAIDQGTSSTKALVVSPEAWRAGRGRGRGPSARIRRRRRSSRTPRRCGHRCSTPAALAVARPRCRSAPSGWRTRARPCWPGIATAGARCQPRCRGRIAAPPGVCERAAARTPTGCASSPGCRSTPTSPRRRCAGCASRSRAPASARPPTPGCCTASAAPTSPTRRQRRGRCCSISTRASGRPRPARIFEVDPQALPDDRRPAPEASARRPRSALASPVAGLAVDQQAALFAEGCLGRARPSAPTAPARSCSPPSERARRRSRAGLVACVAWRLGDRTTYCLDGQVYTVGAGGAWLQRIASDRRAERPRHARRRRRQTLAASSSCPALAGLGGAVLAAGSARRLRRSRRSATSRQQLVRAVIDGIAAQVAWLARAVGRRPRPAAHPAARRRRADPLAPAHADAGRPAAGAGRGLSVAARHRARRRRLARLGIGAGAVADGLAAWQPAAVYEPRIGADEAERRLQRWRRAAERRWTSDDFTAKGAKGRNGYTPELCPHCVRATFAVNPLRFDDEVFDVAVIGAGVVGAAIARELAQLPAHAACCSTRRTTSAPGRARPTPPSCTPASTPSPVRSRRAWCDAATRCLRDYGPRAGIPIEPIGALLVAWDAEQQAAPAGHRRQRRAQRLRDAPTGRRGGRAVSPRAASRPGRARRAGDSRREHRSARSPRRSRSPPRRC